MLPPFSEKLRMELREFDPRPHSREDIELYRAFMGDPDPTSDSGSSHPADEFVQVVLAEAHRAVANRHWQKFEVGRLELEAEMAALRKELLDASARLRSTSVTFSRLLDVEADPLQMADDIEKMIAQIEKAESKLSEVPRAMKPAEADRMAAFTLIQAVLPILEEYGLKIGATVDAGTGKSSPVLQVLKAIGDDINLRLEPVTWRNIVQDYRRRRNAPLEPKLSNGSREG